MTLLNEDKKEIKQYLLGVLSEDARERVEKLLLTEESFFEEVLLVEDELIDLYINDDLTNEERKSFERHFLATPERHRKLNFARAFDKYVSSHSEKSANERDASASAVEESTPQVSPAKSTWAERFRAFWNNRGWALRAATALAVVAVLAVAFWVWRSRTSSPRMFASVTLTASASNRAEGVQSTPVKLPPDADALRVELKLPEASTAEARYRVELENERAETKPLEVVGQDSQSVRVLIEAAQLARGRYVLKLFKTGAEGGDQRLGSYFFTVE